LAALDLGAGVEQPFDCLIVQHRQAMQSMGRSMDWTLEAPPKTYKSNSFHYDFVQFGKHHSRCKAIFSSIVLSQKCCEVYFISLAVAKPL